MEASDDTTKCQALGEVVYVFIITETSDNRTINQEQKDELREWIAKNPNIPKAVAKNCRNEGSKKSNSFMKKKIASLVEAESKRVAKSDAQENNEQQYIMSIVEASVTKTLNQENEQKSQAKPKVSLKSIIQNAKNHGSI